MRANLFLLSLLFGLTACSKLTLENYGKLKVGQSYEDVVAVLGNPARCDESLGIRQCLWGDEAKGVRVGFAAGKALAFSANNLK
jgi:hypothetical protein